MKPSNALLLLGLFLCWPIVARAAGRHNGEADKIRATIIFINPYGQTTADGSGTTYNIPQWNWRYYDSSLIYAPQCRGTVPLYIVGLPMSFDVTLTNLAPHGDKPFKIRVQALSNVLETSCSAGQSLGSQEFLVEDLRPGETRTLHYSLNINDPNLPSGLDVTKIRILHLNQGNNEDAGVILESSAYWCPPSLRLSHP
ncbi:MAG: hypothetical protein AAB262_04600 [Elusimicrobiota bacterium]